jgi:PBP1b-binding outer membrane lipoprotein LpoB
MTRIMFMLAIVLAGCAAETAAPVATQEKEEETSAAPSPKWLVAQAELAEARALAANSALEAAIAKEAAAAEALRAAATDRQRKGHEALAAQEQASKARRLVTPHVKWLAHLSEQAE